MLLITLQSIHTAITVYNYYCLFYIIYCHIRDRHTFFLKVAYVSIGIEAVALLPLGFACPLRVLISRLYSPYTADTFFPDPLARLIMPAGILLFVLTIITKLIQIREHRK